MGTVKIEKIGGLAGYGLPGSRLKSSGETATSALSPADQAWVEALFQKPARSQEAGNERDTHCYRITRTKNGRDQTVEVPEAQVPHALKACVTDRLL
jgi:emfourin